MTFDYTTLAADALALLADYGQTITLARTTGETENAITGATVAGTDASVTTTGVVVDYADNLIDGVKIKRGDRKLIISNEQAPALTDKPTLGGVSFDIVDILTIAPGGTVVIYICQVRNG